MFFGVFSILLHLLFLVVVPIVLVCDWGFLQAQINLFVFVCVLFYILVGFQEELLEESLSAAELVELEL